MKKQYILPFILVTSQFFLWGIANNMTDTLLSAFKRIMSMTDFQSSLIQVAFYGAYFCLAIPASLFISKFSYKSGILLGLGLFALGSLLFYPASLTMYYSHFLFSWFILASGLAILETAANPYIIAMGPEETGTYRLNLAQSFNPIGSITGVVLSKIFILSHLNPANEAERMRMPIEELKNIQSNELHAVMMPYVGVAMVLILLWAIIRFTKMPNVLNTSPNINLRTSIKELFQTPHYIWGVITLFFYCGAQLGTWSFTIRYTMIELDLNEDKAANFYLIGLILFACSRFLFTFLMKFFKARYLLLIAAILGMLLTVIVIFNHSYIGVYALVSVSFCLSLMFPTIFGLAVKGLGQNIKIGSAGAIMAILGCALFPMLQGLISDATNINVSFIVPAVCFLVVALFGATTKD
ncbi:L-fucose:H+ symporter permease [uncultured Algibacter sp.]|uniref:L-fucose:H+ symporter permease n=1 Tax=uncultured Algibacter sp. TaxID=298659 RepID=UPI00262627CD|nr:L-fucose:H+ symporter permease [uncultured Algibacter sp.]